MKPLTKEIADYMHATQARIAAPWTSAVELKLWYFSRREQDMRRSLVIVGSTPENQVLYGTFLARGKELAAAEHIRGPVKDAAE